MVRRREASYGMARRGKGLMAKPKILVQGPAGPGAARRGESRHCKALARGSWPKPTKLFFVRGPVGQGAAWRDGAQRGAARFGKGLMATNFKR